MRAYKLDHLSDPVLLRALAGLVARERTTTADLLAHIAEADARKLYAPAGYPSMFAYCVEELRLSEEAAFKRIHAARTARRFPEIFDALAAGRLHLSAVIMLAPHLRRENAADLLAAATGRTKAEIEQLLAQRFPRTEVLAMVTARPAPAPNGKPDPVQTDTAAAAKQACDSQHAPGRVGTSAQTPRMAPLAPGRFVLQLTIDQDTHEMLRHAQALLGHAVPSGDLAEVVKRALGTLVEKLEKRKFAKTSKLQPRRGRSNANPRHIPAHVKRAVWQRDGGRCTFVSENGRRCNARKFLEYDHIEPVARGGRATAANLRLRCRAHNQHEAERAFGAGFMAEKRAAAGVAARTDEHAADVMAALRSLGVRTDQARRATALSAGAAGNTLEDRVRAALQLLGPRAHTCGRDGASLGTPV